MKWNGIEKLKRLGLMTRRGKHHSRTLAHPSKGG